MKTLEEKKAIEDEIDQAQLRANEAKELARNATLAAKKAKEGAANWKKVAAAAKEKAAKSMAEDEAEVARL